MGHTYNEDLPLEAVVKHLVKERDHYKDKLNQLIVYTKSLEKRLEKGLTWEDAQNLFIITRRYMYELDQDALCDDYSKYPSSSESLFKEVLKRFNDTKK